MVNLGIPHTYRITAYGKVNSDGSPQYQHIYIVVPKNGNTISPNAKRNDYIVIDPVKDNYDDEHPYTAKKDYPMEMQALSGIYDLPAEGINDFVIDGLGKVHARKGKKVSTKPLEVTDNKPGSTQTNPQTQSATVAPVLEPPTRTYNKGVLKDGRVVELGDAVSTPGAYVWTGSGSANGKLIQNYKYLVNGVWDGKTVFHRFMVHKNVLRGWKVVPSTAITRPWNYYMDAGNGLVQLQAHFRDPGIPLGSTDTGIEGLFGIGATGEITKNEFSTLPGLWIPFDVFESLWAKRGANTSNASGLAALGEILQAAGLGALIDQMKGSGNFELDGTDDINGIYALPGYEVMGVEGLGQFANGLHGFATGQISGPYDQIAVMDGLGRTIRARVRRRSKVAADSQSNVSQSQSDNAPVNAGNGGKKLGVYIPGNTLKNLAKLYLVNVKRLEANGHKIQRSSITQIIDGQPINGLGSLFKNFVNKVATAVSKVSEFASPVTSLIPGGQALNVAKILSDHVAENTKPSENNNSQPSTVPSLFQQAQQPQQQAPATYNEKYASEGQSAYNQGVANASGLDGTETSTGFWGWCKQNPIVAVAGAVGVGAVVYDLYEQGKETRPSYSPKKYSKIKSREAKNGIGQTKGTSGVKTFKFKPAK